ncbi:MAG: hypothetical protein ABR586_01270, partial [Thermoplasmatota archaeon]
LQAPVAPPPAPGAPPTAIGAAAAPEAAAGGPRGWLREAWRKLRAKTDRKPAEYRGHVVARLVNDNLDKAPHGPAHAAEFGEAIALAADHAFAGGKGGASTPLGHVLAAGGDYAVKALEAAAGASPPPPPFQTGLPHPPAGEQPPSS